MIDNRTKQFEHAKLNANSIAESAAHKVISNHPTTTVTLKSNHEELNYPDNSED